MCCLSEGQSQLCAPMPSMSRDRERRRSMHECWSPFEGRKNFVDTCSFTSGILHRLYTNACTWHNDILGQLHFCAWISELAQFRSQSRRGQYRRCSQQTASGRLPTTRATDTEAPGRSCRDRGTRALARPQSTCSRGRRS